MLDLNVLRERYAEYLISHKGHSMDDALAYVGRFAYEKGRSDEREDLSKQIEEGNHFGPKSN